MSIECDCGGTPYTGHDEDCPSKRRTPAEPAPASTGREPVAWAVTAERGGIHKLSITRESAERKHAKWLEEWPNNNSRVRPLVFGDVAARELDVEAERREFETRMGPQGDDPTPAWWYHLHAAAEALADHGCEANAANVRDIANNLLDQAAQVSTEQAGDALGRGPRYTCIGKGGNYELIGEAHGAGKAKLIESLAVYRDIGTGRLFFRTTGDFNERMAPSPNNSPVGADKEPNNERDL